ncbi:hypothetical protein EKD04_016655 [Chloroflexales bacterium ZM16-3]|nr:hypothetical protein [Chloroflexales bacterium ZM16-3]
MLALRPNPAPVWFQNTALLALKLACTAVIIMLGVELIATSMVAILIGVDMTITYSSTTPFGIGMAILILFVGGTAKLWEHSVHPLKEVWAAQWQPVSTTASRQRSAANYIVALAQRFLKGYLAVWLLGGVTMIVALAPLLLTAVGGFGTFIPAAIIHLGVVAWLGLDAIRHWYEQRLAREREQIRAEWEAEREHERLEERKAMAAAVRVGLHLGGKLPQPPDSETH